MQETKNRCAWCGTDPLYVKYHDEEWGVPLYDDQLLFEFLVLESFQAGLSWLTVLKKRENFRRAFDNFNPVKMALYDETKVLELMQDASIIRNRMKIEAAINNARLYLDIQKTEGSFSNYVWSFVGGKPLTNSRLSLKDLPAKTDISDAMSKDMGKRGFKFRGSTICYAFMQATGMVNDHIESCFRYKEVNQ